MKIVVDLDWTGFPSNGSPQSLKDMLSDIHFFDVPEGNIKPLITCQECWKWKTRNEETGDWICDRRIWNGDSYGNTDPDDCCKYGTPKESK